MWLISVLFAFLSIFSLQQYKSSLQTLSSFHKILFDGDQQLVSKLMQLYPPDFYPNATDLMLPFGQTRYYFFTQDGDDSSKETIVFVHGISFPSPAFRKVVESLSKRYRVLLYDLYGRGYSDGPANIHDDSMYLSQLSMILLHAGVQRFHFVGFSMGGALAIQFTSYFPGMIQSLVLLAPAGLLDELPLTGRIFNTPLIGELMINTFAKIIMKQGAFNNFKLKPFLSINDIKSYRSKESSTQDDVSYVYELTKFQTDHHPAYQRSFLSTTRHFSLSNKQRIMERLRKISESTHGKLPIYMIWGTDDKLVPYHLHKEILQVVPSAKVFPIQDAGHNIVSENFTQVLQGLNQHFK